VAEFPNRLGFEPFNDELPVAGVVPKENPVAGLALLLPKERPLPVLLVLLLLFVFAEVPNENPLPFPEPRPACWDLEENMFATRREK